MALALNEDVFSGAESESEITLATLIDNYRTKGYVSLNQGMAILTLMPESKKVWQL